MTLDEFTTLAMRDAPTTLPGARAQYNALDAAFGALCRTEAWLTVPGDMGDAVRNQVTAAKSVYELAKLAAFKQGQKDAAEWTAECVKWRGRVLIGAGAHYCFDWDGLPVDESTEEWATCHCFAVERAEACDLAVPAAEGREAVSGAPSASERGSVPIDCAACGAKSINWRFADGSETTRGHLCTPSGAEGSDQ